MPKRERSGRALQDEVSRRIQRLDEIVEDGVRVRVPRPQPHARDGRGRNWDMQGFALPRGYEKVVRAVVDRVRDEFDLAPDTASETPFVEANAGSAQRRTPQDPFAPGA